MKRLFAAMMAIFLVLGDVLLAAPSASSQITFAYPELADSPTPAPDAGKVLPRSPYPSDPPLADAEQFHVREAMESALVKYVDSSGPNAQVKLGEVKVEDHWAYGVVEPQDGEETEGELGHVIAHLLPDGTWQVVASDDSEMHPQWFIEAAPRGLVSSSQISVSFGTYVQDADLQKAVFEALSNRPLDLLVGNQFAVTSENRQSDWLLISVVSLDGPDSLEELVGSGDSAGLMVAKKDTSTGWYVALAGTPLFSDLLDNAPKLLVASEAKPYLDPLAVLPASANSVEYKFPWAEGDWQYRQGWHPANAVDIGTWGADKRVLASAGGTVSYICRGRLSANVHIRDNDGVTLQYYHIDVNQLGSGITEGAVVERGRVLGVLRPGTWSKDDDKLPSGTYCGYTSGQLSYSAHIHWVIPTNGGFTVDGWTITYPDSTWRKGDEARNPGTSPYQTLHSTNVPSDGGGSVCAAPSLIEPSDGAALTNRTVTFRWSALSGCTFNGYTFRVCTSSDVSNLSNCFIDTGEGGTQRAETINDHDNQDLYWGVKAANAPDGAAWAVRRFRIEPGGGGGACQAPTLVEPSDGAVLTNRTITFRWNALSGCTFNGYTFRVCTSSDVNNLSNCLIDTGEGGTQRTETINDHDNQDLYWGVKAANAPDGALWAVRRFRVEPGGGGGACQAPSLVEPSDGAVLTNRTITFRWNALSGCTFNGYTFRVCTSSDVSNLSNCFIDTGEGGTQRTETINDHDNQDLYWGVKAANAPDGASWAVRRFRVEPGGGGSGDVILCTSDDAQTGCYRVWGIIFDLSSEGLNDQIRSAQVPSGKSVFLFREGGLKGTAECYSGNRIPLPQGDPWDLRAQVTGVQVFNTSGCPSSDLFSVVMYDGQNYGSHHWGVGYESGLHNIPRLGGPADQYFNDHAESIRIPAGWSVKLYEHSDKGGRVTNCLTGDISNLGDFNNIASSVEIFHNTTCTPREPPTPSNLTVGNATPDSLTLSWEDNSNLEDGFRIYRWGYDGTEWSFFYHDLVGSNTSSYVDTNLNCETTYFYEVSAYNSGGESAHTVWSSGTTSTCPQPGPIVYDSVIIDDNAYGNSRGNGDGVANCDEIIELYATLRNQGGGEATGVAAAITTTDPYVNWLYNTSSDYADIPGGGTAANSNDFDFALSANAPHGHMVHFDLDITANKGGPWSDGFDVTVNCTDPPRVKLYSSENYSGSVVFSGGTGFSNTPNANSYSMKVPLGWSVKTWREDNRGGEERCWVSSSPYLQGYGWHDAIQSIEVFDSNACPEIRLYDGVNYSGYSGYANNPGRYVLGVNLDDAVESIKMPAGWSVRLYKQNDYSGSRVCIAGSDPDLSNNTFSDGTVAANNASSIEIFDQPDCPQPAPDRPSNLQVTGVAPDSLSLAWQDNSDNEDGFRLYRWGYDGTDWSFMYLASVNANVTSYTDDGLGSDITYYYQLSAYNASGESLRTDWIDGTTSRVSRVYLPFVVRNFDLSNLPAPPAAPTNLRAATVSQTQINLSWTDNSHNESGFRIERSLNGTSGWTQIAAVGANVTAYSDAGLTSSGSYYYRVRAYNAGGNSAYSNTASAVITAITPITAVIISGPTSGHTNTAYTFSAAASPSAATTPIAYTWSPAPVSGQGTAVADYAWATGGVKTIAVTASNAGGSAQDAHTITISAPAADARYVAAGGVDSGNDCTNSAAPCATIQHAVDMATSGQEIRVAEGVYVENLVITQPVTLEGGYEPVGWTRNVTLHQTIIDGSSNRTAWGDWDGSQVRQVAVISDGVEYKMWFDGVNLVGEHQVGLATSGDGISWTKHPANPVLTGTVGAWDESGEHAPFVIKEGGLFKMWYEGSDSSGVRRLGYATSTNGVDWNKYAGSPVLEPGPGSYDQEIMGHGSVLNDAGVYKLWYHASGNQGCVIAYATSPDGISAWVKGGPVFASRAGAWDEYCVWGPSVLKLGVYWMWYSAWGDSGGAIGAVTSTNGVTWTRFLARPVITDTLSIGDPHVISEGGKLKMWYQDFDRGGVHYAESSDGVSWTKSPNNPVLSPGAPGQWGRPVVSFASGSSGAVLDGFTVRNGEAERGGGILVDGTQVSIRHCTVSGNAAYRTGAGMMIAGGAKAVIESNQLVSNSLPSQGGSGVYIDSSQVLLDGNLIAYNACQDYVHGNGAIGVDMGDSSQVVTLTNNVVVSNTDKGIMVSSGVHDLYVVNNTIASNRNEGILAWGTITVPLVRNNIIASNGYCGIAAARGAEFGSIDHNNMWRNGGNYCDYGGAVSPPAAGDGDTSVDPLFIDAAAGDYHVQADSLCIDAGTPAGAPSHDSDGNPRPWGLTHDIGADEFVARSIYVAPGGNCNGAAPCYGSIQSAVDAAAPGDEIRVAAGTYSDVHVRARNDFTTTGTVTQVVYINKTVTIRGGYALTDWSVPRPGMQPTILDALGQGRVIYISGSGRPAIQGVTITGGKVAGMDGGGVFVMAATATLSACQVYSNTVAGDYTAGGGVYLAFSAARLIGNSILGNIAAGNGDVGGGVFMLGSQAVLDDNIISGNRAIHTLPARSSQVKLKPGVIASGPDLLLGVPKYGGGLYLVSSQATLRRNTISHNEAAWGGGLYLVTSRATLLNNTIFSNTASWVGGGIYLDRSDDVLDGNLIQENSATYGGGVYLDSSRTMLANNVIMGNDVGQAGSAVYVEGSSPSLVHNTLVRNTGGDGTAIYITEDWMPVYSSVTMTNTIVASHTLGISVTAGNTAILDGLLWFNTPITVSQAATASVTIRNQHEGAPAFAQDGYHLGNGSAAIDRGIDANIATDIDGEPRLQGAAPDLGADEYSGAQTLIAYFQSIVDAALILQVIPYHP